MSDFISVRFEYSTTNKLNGTDKRQVFQLYGLAHLKAILGHSKKNPTPPMEGKILTPQFFVVGTFEVCIRGVRNFVGFFEDLFRQALCQKLPSIGGVGFFWNVPLCHRCTLLYS